MAGASRWLDATAQNGSSAAPTKLTRFKAMEFMEISPRLVLTRSH
jgi:hypothetical protein